MQVNFQPISNMSTNNSLPNYHIISKFLINNSIFLIICVEPSIVNNQQIASNIIIDTIYFPVVSHFEFEGHSYAIVKAHQASEDIDISLISLLTERELQITTLVALGWSNKKVAKQLQISDLTVSAHLRRIYIKLKVDSRSAMVYRCASLINLTFHKIWKWDSLCDEWQ